MKNCPNCKKEKELIYFSKNKSAKSGHNSWCKVCEKLYRQGEGKEKIQAYKKKNSIYFGNRRRERTSVAKREALIALGSVCCVCGFSDLRALQIDHINGGGSKKQMRGNRAVYYKKVVLDGGKTFQLLCANCNWIKRYQNKESTCL